MKLTFLGAAGTVTGSKYLIEHEGHRLLVDCGLFQGYKNLRLMNWEPFPFDPANLTPSCSRTPILTIPARCRFWSSRDFAGRY